MNTRLVRWTELAKEYAEGTRIPEETDFGNFRQEILGTFVELCEFRTMPRVANDCERRLLRSLTNGHIAFLILLQSQQRPMRQGLAMWRETEHLLISRFRFRPKDIWPDGDCLTAFSTDRVEEIKKFIDRFSQPVRSTAIGEMQEAAFGIDPRDHPHVMKRLWGPPQ